MEMESTVPLQSRRTPKERKSPRRTAKTMQPMEAMVNPMIQTVVSQKSRTPPIPPTMSLR